jgi:hypothetical protein
VGFGQRIRKALALDTDPEIRDGVSGDALVIDAHAGALITDGPFKTTGAALPGHWVGEVIAVVRLPGEQPYQATVAHWMDRARYALPGQVIPVTVERGDHSKVLLNWDAIPEIDTLVASGASLFTDPDSVERTVREAVASVQGGAVQAGYDAQVEELQSLGMRDKAQMVREALAARGDEYMPSAEGPARPPVPTDRPTARIVSIMEDRAGFEVGSRITSEFLLSVNIPGRPRYGARWKGLEHTRRAYDLWRDIPVEVDAENPNEVKILWDDMQDAGSAIAGRLNEAAGEMQAKLAQASEMQQQAMAAYTAPAAVSPAAADPLDQIERLAKLHDSGALTDEEFAAEKKRILGRS